MSAGGINAEILFIKAQSSNQKIVPLCCGGKKLRMAADCDLNFFRMGNLGFLVTMSKWARKLNTDPPLLVLQTQFHKLQVLRRAMVPSRAIRFVAGHFRIDSSKQTLHQIFIAEKVQVSNIIDTIHSGVVKTRTGITSICFICRTTDRFVHLRMLIPFKHLLGD